jgi:hypothetical protein
VIVTGAPRGLPPPCRLAADDVDVATQDQVLAVSAGSTTTTSSGNALSIADWIVGYCVGTTSVAAGAAKGSAAASSKACRDIDGGARMPPV